jgi:protein TonB
MVLPLISRDLEIRRASNRVLRYALLAALLLHLLLFLFYPHIEFKPYKLPYESVLEVVYPDEIIVPPAPAEVHRPVVAIEPSDEGEVVEDVDLPPTVFQSIEELPVQHLAVPQEPVQEFPEFDTAPALVTSADPIYPELAKQAGVEGTVLLRLVIGKKGTVLGVEIIRSDVTPAMEKAAIAAAWQFRFQPAMRHNLPVKAHLVFPMTFELR